MKKLFPTMTDRPENGMTFAMVCYGFIVFILLPVYIVYMGVDVWDKTDMLVWLELVYHGLNGVVVAAIFMSYLRDSFLNVQLFTKNFVKIVAIATAIMLTLALGLRFALGLAYPIHELTITMYVGFMLEEQPLWSTLCLSLLSPFAVAGVFYAVGFAPWCCKKPWLGYLIVPIVLIIPLALDINWRGGAEYTIPIYFLQLPIHLIACWSYQKADTIWAPITCLAIFNLGTSILNLLPL